MYNFSVWTVLRGLQGKNWLFVYTSWIMHALDNLIFREQKTVWMDWHLLLRESWKVSRERRLLIWFKDMVEKLPNQWARKQVMSWWDGILERANFLRYSVMHRTMTQTYKLHLSPQIFITNAGAAYCKNTWETCHKFAWIDTLNWRFVSLYSKLTRNEKFTRVEGRN